MFGIGHPRGSRRPLGAMHEGRDLLDERWVYSVGCGGSCSTHNPRPVPPEARGVAGRDMVDRSCGEVTGSAPRTLNQTKLEVSVAHTRRRCPSGSAATKV